MSDHNKSNDCNHTVAVIETGTRTKSIAQHNNHQSKVVRVKDAPSYISVSRSHYHNFRNPKSPYYQNDFPEIVQLSSNCKGHLKRDLDVWLNSKLVGGVS